MKLLLTILLASVFLASGCSPKDEPSDKTVNGDGKIKIYSTVYPLEDFAQRIGGKYVSVQSVYPPGTDEHSFEPSQNDIIKMTDSDLFLYIGHGLEGFVVKAEGIFKSENVKMTAVGEKIDLPHVEHHADEDNESNHKETEAGHEHDHGDVDPHIWLDPVIAKQMAEVIKEDLVKEKPEKKEYFEKNYKALAHKLDQLDNQFKSTVKAADRKEIIVSHAAYGYWEKRYGIKQISVAGLSTSDEPSQKQLQEVVKTAKDHKLKYILFEQNVSSKLTETIQKEIGATPMKLHNISVLTENDMKNKEDYFSLMNRNLTTLKTVLSN